MKKERVLTEVGVLVDESGSMAGCSKETVQGHGDFLRTLQETPADVRVSLTLFDSAHRVAYEGEYLANAQGLDGDKARYNPASGGGTALFDAFGDAVDRHAKRAAEAGRVIMAIITDGEDNESQRLRKEDVRRIVKEKEATGKWQFIWLGPTGSRTAAEIGIKAENTFKLSDGAAGIRAAIAQVAERTQQLLLSAGDPPATSVP